MNHRTPAATVGVVGGGQLGRMMGEAAGPLGVEVLVSDPTPDCPAAPVVRDQIVGDFDDADAIRELAERADVLTFEIELADPDAMERIGEETDTPVTPIPRRCGRSRTNSSRTGRSRRAGSRYRPSGASTTSRTSARRARNSAGRSC